VNLKIALLVLAVGGGAKASEIQVVLNLANVAGYPSPYAMVTIDVANGGGVAMVDVEGLSLGGFNYEIGGAGAVGLNLTKAATANTFSWIGGNGLTGFSNGGSGNEDGYGSFSLTVDGFGGFTQAVTDLKFVVTPTSGVFANALSVLTPNGNLHDAADHIFIASKSCDAACNTMFASNSAGPVVVPDSATSIPAMLGLAVIAGYAKLKNRRHQKRR
jgi:hypothetical protein